MPPKGWRKDAQGNYPATSYMKEQENITIEDLLFPRSVIVGLAKDVQQISQSETGDQDTERKLVINKDASIALQRSATIFVNHLLMFAREIAKEQDKRSCNMDDILAAVEYVGFPGLKNVIMDKMVSYQQAQSIIKEHKKDDQTKDTNKTEDENNEELTKDDNEEDNEEGKEEATSAKKTKISETETESEVVVEPQQVKSEQQTPQEEASIPEDDNGEMEVDTNG